MFGALIFYRYVPDKMGYRHHDSLWVYAAIVLFADLVSGFRLAYSIKDERKETIS
jgi:hypothetical protein